jgi:hypothetical protein
MRTKLLREIGWHLAMGVCVLVALVVSIEAAAHVMVHLMDIGHHDTAGIVVAGLLTFCVLFGGACVVLRHLR